MGIGIITKGVGFVPALMLIPYAYAVRKEQPLSGEWEKLRVTVPDRLRKRRAVLAYASQLPLLSLSRRQLNLLLLQSEAISWSPA